MAAPRKYPDEVRERAGVDDAYRGSLVVNGETHVETKPPVN
jgi:hypothetical protein